MEGHLRGLLRVGKPIEVFGIVFGAKPERGCFRSLRVTEIEGNLFTTISGAQYRILKVPPLDTDGLIDVRD